MKSTNSSLMFAALASLALLAGCASSGGSQPESAAPAAEPAAAPSASTASGSAPVVEASSDMGTIVFFREKKFAGSAVSFKVREGDQELGKLSSGTYFVSRLAPGPHEFTVHSEAKDLLNIELEAGETYYVQGSISMGVLVGRPNLSPSDVATFDAMKTKLKDSAAPKTKKR
jgi:Protein of unknown function (DUF2846)